MATTLTAPFKRAAIIGAGQMGLGIASVSPSSLSLGDFPAQNTDAPAT